MKIIRRLVFNFFVLVSFIASAESLRLPAVDGFNSKFGVEGGNSDGGNLIIGTGSISFPLGNRFGAQIDGLWGKVDGSHDPNKPDRNSQNNLLFPPESISDGFLGIAGHFFWRDPHKGMLGLTAGRIERDIIEEDENPLFPAAFLVDPNGGPNTTVKFDVQPIVLNHAGIEGEYYFERFTLGVNAGETFGDVTSHNYVNIYANYYPIDSLAISFQGSRASPVYQFTTGVRWQPKVSSSRNLTLYIEKSFGDRNNNSIIAGIQFQFGKRKTLIRQHREADPNNNLRSHLINSFALTACRDEVITFEKEAGVSFGELQDFIRSAPSKTKYNAVSCYPLSAPTRANRVFESLELVEEVF